MKKERERDRSLKKGKMKNHNAGRSQSPDAKKSNQNVTHGKNYTKKVASHKCNKHRIQSDMDEHSLFLENCPPLDEQFRNKGATNKLEKVSSKQYK